MVFYGVMATRLEARLANDLNGVFPDMVRAHQDRLFSAVLAMVRHRQDAEDVTQDTLVRAYRALSTYDAERIAAMQLRPWLATIALNVVRNRARTAGRRPRTVAPPPGFDATDTDSGPEEELVWSVEADVWRERLAELSVAQRKAVVLRHVWGLPYKEIAETMNMPEGTARAHVHRGLAALRTTIEEES